MGLAVAAAAAAFWARSSLMYSDLVAVSPCSGRYGRVIPESARICGVDDAPIDGGGSARVGWDVEDPLGAGLVAVIGRVVDADGEPLGHR